MYCINCGDQLNETAKFCSGCGKDVADVPALPGKPRDWDLHVSLLAWIFIAQAVLTGIFGLAIMFAGVVLRRVVIDSPSLLPPDVPQEAAYLIGPVTFFIGVLLLVISIPSIASGFGLLHYRNWGRVLTLVLSFFKILEVPLGTATAIYAFWVLLSQGGREFYRRKALT